VHEYQRFTGTDVIQGELRHHHWIL
jgi:hypothetical protein